MIEALRPDRRRALVVTATFLALGALAGTLFVGVPALPISGGITGLILAVLLAGVAIAVPLAIARPLVFPLALWAAIIPFDSLLTFSGVGQIGKPLGALAALAALISILARRRSIMPPPAAATWVAYMALAVASLTWTGISGYEPAMGLLLIQQTAGLLVVGILVSLVPADAYDLTALFCGVLVGGVGASLYEIAMFGFTGTPVRIVVNNAHIDHNHFGAALLLPMIAATMAALSSRNLVRTGLCLMGALICLLGMGVSQSRGALIAFGIAAAYIVWRSRHRWRLVPVLVTGAVMLAVTPGVIARFSDPTAGDAAGRYEIWQVGFAAFKHHWFAGSGFGTFLQAYQTALLEAYQSTRTPSMIQAHNLFVQVAVELGVLGLVAIAAAWWFQFRALRTIGPDEGGWTDARIAMEATTIALFVTTLSLDNMTFKYMWLGLIGVWIVRSAHRTSAAGAACACGEEPHVDAPAVLRGTA